MSSEPRVPFKGVVSFFDKFEDKLRFRLSRHPVLYALIGAVGVILLWKGVWEIAAAFPALTGLPSLIIGVVILLATGLLVSFFVGDSIILSGFKGEKKLAEKTEREVRTERELLGEIAATTRRLEQEITERSSEG